jgi:hypothetical protein
MRIAWLLLIAACGSSGSTNPPPSSVPPAALTKDDAVLEAVALHELKAAPPAADEAVCVAIRGGTTDGTALLAAIRTRYPTAVANSECTGGGMDPVTLIAGGKALRIDIGPVTWSGDVAGCGGGGVHRGGGSAREVKYIVEKSGGGYKVTNETVVLQN